MRNIINFVVFLILSVSLISCEEKEEHPKIETLSIQALSASRFEVKAQLVEKGNIPITDYGFVYSIGNGPTPARVTSMNNKISLGQELSTDSFSTTINVENPSYYSESKCYVSAYITNEKGTIFGKAVAADILRLQATSIVPNYSKAGDTIVITGSNFDLIASNNTVSFNSTAAVVINATSTKLYVIVPTGINTSYYDSYVPVRIKSGNQTIDLNYNFSLGPSPTSFSPKSGTWNSTITIYGSGLGNTTVYFNDIGYSYYNSSNGYISMSIPSDLPYKTFKIYIGKNGKKTEVPGGSFTMNKMQISSYNPKKCNVGSTLTVYGSFFNPNASSNKLHIGNQTISSSSYYNYLQFKIPEALAKGEYTAFISNGIDSVGLPEKITIVQPEITSISPGSGYPNSSITLKGSNLFNSSYSTYVYFGNYSVGATAPDSSTIKATVPNLDPGTYSIFADVGSVRIASPEKFTILAPTLSSISPATGAAGTSVIINGEGFGTTTNNVYVYFGGLQVYPMLINNTQINVKVPTNITKGTWMVSVYINGKAIPTTLTFEVP